MDKDLYIEENVCKANFQYHKLMHSTPSCKKLMYSMDKNLCIEENTALLVQSTHDLFFVFVILLYIRKIRSGHAER